MQRRNVFVFSRDSHGTSSVNAGIIDFVVLYRNLQSIWSLAGWGIGQRHHRHVYGISELSSDWLRDTLCMCSRRSVQL